MKTRKILLSLLLTAPFAITSCNNAYTREQTKEWVHNNYTGEVSQTHAAIATFSWDYHGTTGTAAMAEVENLFKYIFPAMIEEFKDVIYWPGENRPIGKSIIVYHTLWIPPLTEENFDDKYPEREKTTYKINGKELSVTDNSQKTIDEYQFATSIIHVHNQYGYYRGIGIKINRGFIDKKNIVKVKAIIELMYEEN